MNTISCYSLWAGLFILSAGLGFIPQPGGVLKFCMVMLSIGFFVPPALLLKLAQKRGDRLNIRIVRNLALASLGLTIGLILANFMSFMAPEALGNMLYVLLTIVSAPMICGQYWVLSLFLWACLLLWAQSLMKKK
jgi:hypothetical protein